VGYYCRAVLERRRRRWGLHIVTLPHLRLITFRDTTPRCFVLLILRIDAPPTAHRYLFWRSWAVASWEHWSGMLDAMGAFILRDSVFGAGWWFACGAHKRRSRTGFPLPSGHTQPRKKEVKRTHCLCFGLIGREASLIHAERRFSSIRDPFPIWVGCYSIRPGE
jgi:hypothetical protein